MKNITENSDENVWGEQWSGGRNATNCVNIELAKWIVTLDCQCMVNAYYSRKECVEVVGIPHQVDDIDLLRMFLRVLIRVTVKLTYKKDCKQVLQIKKKLEGLDRTLDLSHQGVQKHFWIKVCAHIMAFRGLKLNVYKVWVK